MPLPATPATCTPWNSIAISSRVCDAQYDDNPNVTIHEADALQFDFAALGEKLRIVGNLPYNISTPLLFHLLKFRDRILDMHFMLQKEVVERMAASPGSKTYGRLGIMLGCHLQVESLFDVDPPRVLTATGRHIRRRAS